MSLEFLIKMFLSYNRIQLIEREHLGGKMQYHISFMWTLYEQPQPQYNIEILKNDEGNGVILLIAT